MKLPGNIARSILDREALIVCRPLTQRSFVDQCKSHGLDLTVERLRSFEKLGVFFPIFRIYKPDITMKIERTSNNSYRTVGQLHDHDNWNGRTRQEIAKFGFSPRIYKSWIDAGLIWCPRTEQSELGQKIDTENERHEAFYSVFQIFELQYILNQFNGNIQFESFLDKDKYAEFTNDEWLDYLRNCAIQAVEVARGVNLPTYQPIVAQLISNRYFPQALSDRRTIRITQRSLEFPDWDWHRCVDEWRPADISDLMELEPSDVENLHGQLVSQVDFIDPLANWHELLELVSVEKRQRLKNDALRAERFRQMASMLANFYKDLTSNPIGDRRSRCRTSPTDGDAKLIKELEYVTNSFGVNPRPQLTMIVEGETEEQVLPIIFSKVFGAHNSVTGIEIVNLQGVENIVGTRHDRRTAIVRLVDYLHHHQTICFIILDNEGSAKGMRQKLLPALSSYSTGRRVTRYNYLKIWNKSFEYDNFSDTEIADALSKISGNYVFQSKDVKNYRHLTPHGNLKNSLKKELRRSLANLSLEKSLSGLCCQTELDGRWRTGR